MKGPGLPFGLVIGEDRVYVPVKVRSKNYSKNWKQQEHHKSARGDANGVEKPNDQPLCNLDRFMEAVTPSVPAQFFPKTRLRGLRSSYEESQPYFELCDLWESFKEWSAYGAGVPMLMNGRDRVVQYYVPSLSAIQLYRDLHKHDSTSRQSEDSDLDAFRDTSSDCSSECEPQLAEYNVKFQNHTLTAKMENLSLLHSNNGLRADSSSDESDSLDSQGHLLFEYFEKRSPYAREPLAEKISELSCWFPELLSLRSCDLLSSSWISVAWYPIYRIPAGLLLKDLDACFLTFHSLHTPKIGASSLLCPTELHDGLPRISLPVFGLSTYKFKGASWVPYGGSEHPLVRSLGHSVHSWLKRHNVSHPDYLHFCRR